MVGSSSSNVANSQIPITNGALDLRSAYPTRINYVRLAPADDIQGPASASFAFNDLDARDALVVDDAGDAGQEIADAFEQAFKKLGGRTVRRALNPGGILRPSSSRCRRSSDRRRSSASAASATPVPRSCARRWSRRVMPPSRSSAGTASGMAPGQTRAPTSNGSVPGQWVPMPPTPPSVPSEPTSKTASGKKYRAAPDEYAGAAYACAEVILQTLREAAKTSPTADGLREAVRSYAVDPEHTYQTALGTVGFDANGDSIQQFVNLYRVESPAAGGKGDWVIARQQNFGPAPWISKTRCWKGDSGEVKWRARPGTDPRFSVRPAERVIRIPIAGRDGWAEAARQSA
jgi:hypothetical protein